MTDSNKKTNSPNEFKTLEIEKGLKYISSGIRDLNSEKNSAEERLKAYKRVHKGAYILNTQSNILYRERLLSKKKWDLDSFRFFPTDMREVIRLCEVPLCEWFDEFPIFEKYTPSLENNYDQFFDSLQDNQTEGADRYVDHKSEYDLYEEFTESLAFSSVRNACVNDEDYCNTRAYLPKTISDSDDEIYTLFNTTSRDLTNKVFINYYEPFESIKGNIFKFEQGYGICTCGYVLTKNSLGEIECAHAKCRHIKKLKREETIPVGYVENITYIIKQQFHRFITLPAIEELKLFDELKEYEDAGVISNLRLYPYKDAADISFEYNETLHIIDVKEWVDAISLVRYIEKNNGLVSRRFDNEIRRLNGNYMVHLVIPDYLCNSLKGKSKYKQRLEKLNEGLTPTDKKYIHINTTSKFVKSNIKEKIRKKRKK